MTKTSADVKILDKNEKVVAEFDVSSKMGIGILGGDANTAIEYLADEITKQIKENFYK